ncbi:MAG: hypothetical protein L6R28_23610 [Planctomycetes bacterium]|nr:hypothetical protein [Planctomycetota bacterium]
MVLRVYAPILAALALGGACLASDLDEFKVKREANFEFAAPPKVARAGDRVTVSFETKGFCDVTVAVEDGGGKIRRHLASGVLGEHAPQPFQKGSKVQAIVWDGKDDAGRYVDDADDCVVRVSLGLSPKFERTLFWSPYRRSSMGTPVVCAAPEGVYVYDGLGVDHLRLFTHDGTYVRTVHPFAADAFKDVQGLKWQEFPQGERLPVKRSVLMQTFLTSGDNGNDEPGAIHDAMNGNAATAMAVRDGRIALVKRSLNRLAAEGGTGGLPMDGPRVTRFEAINPNSPYYGPPKGEVFPRSVAFSPDGKWLYLAGYAHLIGDPRGYWDFCCQHGILRMEYGKDAEPVLFAGKTNPLTRRENNMEGSGSAPGQFALATSVACDAQGRVYVSDYLNDRVQVFDDAGKVLKAIPVKRPAKVQVDPKTGELWVGSWLVHNPKLTREEEQGFKRTLTHLGPFDNPKVLETFALPNRPFIRGQGNLRVDGSPQCAEVDLYATPPRLWVCTAKDGSASLDWASFHLRVYELKGGQCVPLVDGGADAERALGGRKAPTGLPQVQYLYAHPKTGKLYVAEPEELMYFSKLVELDPETGAAKTVDLPFMSIDLAFDTEGAVYLRSTNVVARYDFKTWREIPWDYGEELDRVGAKGDRKTAPLIGGLVIPSVGTNQTHQGGMSVTAKGELAVSCVNFTTVPENRTRTAEPAAEAKRYLPQLYPGRQARECIHIFDKHGQLLRKDAAPGLGRTDGVWLDGEGALYVMTVGHRIHDGKRYFNNRSSTLVKLRPEATRGYSTSQRQEYVPVGLEESQRPKRGPELYGLGDMWLDGAEWFYGGVGFAGKNLGGDAEMGCCCWHATFALDFYARSFAPEVDRYSVAVVDKAGNLVTRIGRYGNVDEGKPLVAGGGPANARSIGGDELSLYHACYVAAQTDKRLFVADLGNGRVASVRILYAADARVPLKAAP